MQRNAKKRSVFQLTRNVAILSGNHGKNAVPRNATWRQYTLIFGQNWSSNSQKHCEFGSPALGMDSGEIW